MTLVTLHFPSSFACLEGERSVLESKTLEGEPVKVCWSGKRFRTLISGREENISYPVPLSHEENLMVFLNSNISKEDKDTFQPSYEGLLQNYLEGVGDRATESMTGSVVSLVDMLNDEKFLSGYDCNNSKLTLDFDIEEESQMRCVVSTATLPQEVVEKMNHEFSGTGQIDLKKLLADFPETQVILRSKVANNPDGSPREINPRSVIPLESFLQYDLILKFPEGEFKAVGRCYDWEENLFSIDGRPREQNNILFKPSEDVDDYFTARISDSWRIPFGLDVEDGEVKRKNGEDVPSVDFGLNTSLNYRKDFSGGGSIEIGPGISYPFLKGITGPSDVMDMNSLNLDFRSTTITLGGSIKF